MDQPTINETPQGGSPPLEMPNNLKAPEPMGQKSSEPSNQTYVNSPSPQEGPPQTPKSPKPILSYLLILLLFIVLVGGTLLFAAWRGWISLGGVFENKPTPSPSVSPQISPAISPLPSPDVSSTPQVTSNVNDETRKKDLANIKSALRKYYLDKSEYPKSEALIKTSDKTSVLATAVVPAYLESLPDDPQAPQFYYGYKSDGQNYELTAVLEDKSDPSGVLTGAYNIYKITNSSVE